MFVSDVAIRQPIITIVSMIAVEREVIVRHVEMGKGQVRASHQGTDHRALPGRAVHGGVIASAVRPQVASSTVYESGAPWRSGVLRRARGSQAAAHAAAVPSARPPRGVRQLGANLPRSGAGGAGGRRDAYRADMNR